MTDILDEILAATESVRAKPQPVPVSNLSLPFLSDPGFPSPRGVQDEIPFALLHNPPAPYFDKPEVPVQLPVQLSVEVPSPAPPAVSASRHVPHAFSEDPHRPRWGGPNDPHPPGPSPAPASRQGPPDAPQPQQSIVGAATRSSAKRAYSQMTDSSNAQPEARAPSHSKKPKTEASVMPPSAKSILERREKAIREGRRKDAKLTDAERRILRRLRNRESAERCRLRRVQQAAQLEKKIESMQIENDRLVAMAEEYEKTIQRLEKTIAEYSKRSSSS